MVDPTGTTFEERLSQAESWEDYSHILSRSVYNIIRSFNPHEIIIECDIQLPCEDIVPFIRADMIKRYGITEDELPEMIRARCKFRNSHRGLAIGLREMWLESLVFANH